MSRTVILLSFDDQSTYEAHGIQDAYAYMDKQQASHFRLVGCRTSNDDDYASIQAYRTLLSTTVGGDTHE